jgi:hypothetical protein
MRMIVEEKRERKGRKAEKRTQMLKEKEVGRKERGKERRKERRKKGRKEDTVDQ